MSVSYTFEKFEEELAESFRMCDYSAEGRKALYHYLEDTFYEGFSLYVPGLCATFIEFTIKELKSEFRISEHIPDGDNPDDIGVWACALEDYAVVIPVNKNSLILGGL